MTIIMLSSRRNNNVLSDLLHDDKVDDNIARYEIDEWSITVKANHKLQDTNQKQKYG